jgi:hypothetical protein
MILGYVITCPNCGYSGDSRTYEPSCADECECPKCHYAFTFEYPEDDDEEEDEP